MTKISKPEKIILYYKAGACSLADHMILAQAQAETGLPYETQEVDLKTRKLKDGKDYYEINPRGAVPALEVQFAGKKHFITQNCAILSYIGDISGIEALSPAQGTLARARLNEALGFCSDLHAAYSPLLHPEAFDLSEEALAPFKEKAHRRLKELESWLPEHGFWLGEAFTQADAYVAVILNWSRKAKIDLIPYKKARALKEKVFALPAAKVALKAEGLL